ncbi:MAG: SelL-related redox protein [Phycisphaerae bacterium]|jgi:peroxiredoxin
MTACLRAAALYNLAWGAWTILFPKHFWSLVGMPAPEYLFLWQCIGMIVGVYGVGYWFAANDVARHWPIVLVGFLGKIFGPIGFVQAHFIDGAVPLRFGWTLITNDLIWWLPFAAMLVFAYRAHERERARHIERLDADAAELQTALISDGPARGISISTLSEQRPVLLVFLRHLGCTFCREAAADLRDRRGTIEAAATIVVVTMSPPAESRTFLAGYGLSDVDVVSDPDRTLYRAMELRRGSIGQLFGPRVWLRGVVAGLFARHFVGGLRGDGLQMPGAFVISRGRVIAAFRHRDAADRPDYCAMVTS